MQYGWLFWVERPFETVFQFTSGHLPEREKERRNERREKKCPNIPHPHLLQAQKALALLLSKLVGRPGTGSLPSTIAPPDLRPSTGMSRTLFSKWLLLNQMITKALRNILCTKRKEIISQIDYTLVNLSSITFVCFTAVRRHNTSCSKHK